MITMYDSIEVSTVPPNPPAVAGYVGGSWPTFSPLVQRFPQAKHLSIAVSAFEDAECLDVEAGDAVPAQVPAWFVRQRARGVKRPVIYSSVSEMPSILLILANAGFPRQAVRVWTAHYTYSPHLCSPKCGFGFNTTADATQWNDHALGRNLDQSLCADGFFGVARPVKNATHYEWFDKTPRFVLGLRWTEVAAVKRYDRLRATQTKTRHPHRVQLGLLRRVLRYLAGRVLTVARTYPVHGKPSWGNFHRGWRYQQLIHRAQGGRVV